MQLRTWDSYNHGLAEVGFLYYNNILKGKHVNFAIAACLHLGPAMNFGQFIACGCTATKTRWHLANLCNRWPLDFPCNTIWIIKKTRNSSSHLPPPQRHWGNFPIDISIRCAGGLFEVDGASNQQSTLNAISIFLNKMCIQYTYCNIYIYTI